MMIVPLEDDLVNISQFWWLFVLFLKIIENCIFQNIVQSENVFFQIWYISPIPVEHYTEKWEKNIWNGVLVTKCCWGNFAYLKTIPLTSHWPECIDIWYEALPWDKEIQVCANKILGVINGLAPRGHILNEHVRHVSQVSDLRLLRPLVCFFICT